MKDEVTVHSPAELDAAELDAFLERVFGTRKAAFLSRHGAWWHRGDENRQVYRVNGELGAYTALIPIRLHLGGRERSASWLVDVMVAPELRGRGIQTVTDVELRRRADLILGVPNELAGKIHKKHGWGVREDARSLLAPLDPPRLGPVRRAAGPRGRLLRTAAAALVPAAALWRRRLRAYRPRSARELVDADAGVLAAVARRGPESLVTTVRDASQLAWRYLEAPYRDELLFYVAGEPSIAIVSRRLVREGHVEERLLDLFGEIDDRALLGDAVRFALAEAVRAGAVQVTVLASNRELAARLRRLGFLAGTVSRFCWLSDDRATMDAIAGGRLHFTLGDSDNDAPL